MEGYFQRLLTSSFPFPDWGVVAAWLVLFAASHFATRKAAEVFVRQSHMKSSDPIGLLTRSYRRMVVMQILLAGAIFGISRLIWEPFFVFLGGAWLCMGAVSIALSLQSIAFYSALARPGSAEGTLTISDRMVVENSAARLYSAAALCLILGLLLAHLALIGAAVYLTATASGYMQRAALAPSL